MNVDNIRTIMLTVRNGAEMSSDSDLGRAIGVLPGSNAYVFVNTAQLAMGILVKGDRSGGEVTMGVVGAYRYQALNTQSFGMPLTVGQSAMFTNAGSGTAAVGRNYGNEGTEVSNAASGQWAFGVFNFASPVFIGNSLGLPII